MCGGDGVINHAVIPRTLCGSLRFFFLLFAIVFRPPVLLYSWSATVIRLMTAILSCVGVWGALITREGILYPRTQARLALVCLSHHSAQRCIALASLSSVSQPPCSVGYFLCVYGCRI